MYSAMLANTPSRQVKSVRTAFELVDRLQALGGATPAELTEELDLSKSSVHNYLTTLEMKGYVVNDGGRYRLGIRFLTHGVAAKNTQTIEAPVRRTLESTAKELAAPVWWVVEELGRGYFLENATLEGQRPTYGSVGKRSYLHTHALGKAILATATDDYVDRVAEHHGLPERTSQTTTNIDALAAEIETIRERGFAVSEGEAVLGILSVGVGFRDTADRRHAIGIFGQSQNFAGNQSEHVGERLLEAVDDLERTLEEGV
jgi:DNA-binding IclR family transcriptional regulator